MNKVSLWKSNKFLQHFFKDTFKIIFSKSFLDDCFLNEDWVFSFLFQAIIYFECKHLLFKHCFPFIWQDKTRVFRFVFFHFLFLEHPDPSAEEWWWMIHSCQSVSISPGVFTLLVADSVNYHRRFRRANNFGWNWWRKVRLFPFGCCCCLIDGF